MARKHQHEKNEEIKRMIIDAALNICLTDGYKEVTVRRIGDMIGYSTGVIYYHFRDKQDILDSLDQKLDEEAYNAVKSIIDPTLSIRENLSLIYDFTCDLAYNNTEAYKRMFVTSRIENNDFTRNMWLELIKNIFTVASERGEISADKIECRAKSTLAYIMGYNLLFFEINRTTFEAAKAERDKAINFILSAILS